LATPVELSPFLESLCAPRDIPLAINYDADGSGKGKAVEIASVTKGLSLKHDDFFVI
jgi:hypothetical protein